MVQKFKLNQKWTGKDKLLRKIIKQSCDENINDPCDQKVIERNLGDLLI